MTKLTYTGNGSEIYNSEIVETTYDTYFIQVKNTKYQIIIAKGRFNYINVKQVNYNRSGTGKDFATIDMAISAYKSIQMKAALMQLPK
jgi:hypothetical protein